MEPEQYWLEVLRFSGNGSHIPLACHGPLSQASANALFVEYNTQVLPLLEKATGHEHFCGLVNRKRYEVMIRPDFFVSVTGASYEPRILP